MRVEIQQRVIKSMWWQLSKIVCNMDETMRRKPRELKRVRWMMWVGVSVGKHFCILSGARLDMEALITPSRVEFKALMKHFSHIFLFVLSPSPQLSRRRKKLSHFLFVCLFVNGTWLLWCLGTFSCFYTVLRRCFTFQSAKSIFDGLS